MIYCIKYFKILKVICWKIYTMELVRNFHCKLIFIMDINFKNFRNKFISFNLIFFQTVSVTVSVMTLTSISIDRWYAICHPLKFKSTTSRAKTAIIIIWIVGLASGIQTFNSMISYTVKIKKINSTFE